jgi:hypothetical protein
MTGFTTAAGAYVGFSQIKYVPTPAFILMLFHAAES